MMRIQKRAAVNRNIMSEMSEFQCCNKKEIGKMKIKISTLELEIGNRMQVKKQECIRSFFLHPTSI